MTVFFCLPAVFGFVRTVGDVANLGPTSASAPLGQAERFSGNTREALSGLDDLPESAQNAQEDDERLDALIARAQNLEGREHLSSLSALSQRMNAYEPLSGPEQLKCIAAVKAGVGAQRALDKGGLSARKVREHKRVAARGQEAQAELVGSMYRLVLVICQEQAADRYGRERMWAMLPDLVSEANLAVLGAVKTFNPSRPGAAPSFSKYAGRVIRDRVRTLVHRGEHTGVPVAWLRLKRLYVARYPEVVTELGRAPSEAEMQDELRAMCFSWTRSRLSVEEQQLSESEQQLLVEAKLRRQGMLGGIERLGQVLTATTASTSLDAPVGEEGNSTLVDTLKTPTSGGEFEQVEAAELRDDLMAALRSFTDREQEIVLRKYGFVDGEQWTYARLAPLFDVSPERIRQIERSVLAKLAGSSFDSLSAHLPGQ